MFEKEAEKYAYNNKIYIDFDNDITDYGNVKEAYQDGAEFGYNKANEWHYVKDGDLPKKDCEVVTLHENGNKNIIKWKNGNWTNAILIPVIAWKEIVLPEKKDCFNSESSLK